MKDLLDNAQSTSPPTEWVERLFSKLLTLYGTRFADMWRGVSVDEVKKTWTAALSRYPLETIRDALGKLAVSNPHPPTLPEFIAICDSVYRPAPQKALKLDLPPPDPEAPQKLRAMYEKLEKPTPARKWAYDIIERAHRGEGYPLTPAAIQIAAEAVRIDKMMRSKPEAP